jgi:hypothetical protein
MMERNAEEPVLVTRDENPATELVRAALVVAPLAYTGVLLYLHMSTGEVSAWKLVGWIAACSFSIILARYFPRKYLVLYKTYIFGGIALKKWVFVLAKSIPFDEVTRVIVSEDAMGPHLRLVFSSGRRSLQLILIDRRKSTKILKIVSEKVNCAVFDEDARRHLYAREE